MAPLLTDDGWFVCETLLVFGISNVVNICPRYAKQGSFSAQKQNGAVPAFDDQSSDSMINRVIVRVSYGTALERISYVYFCFLLREGWRIYSRRQETGEVSVCSH